MKFRTFAILTAITALVAVAGCGGGDDSSTTTAAAPPLTKEEYITQADKICTDGDAAINAAATDAAIGPSSTETEINDFVTGTVLPNIQSQVDQISALTPPAGDEDQVGALVDALNTAVTTATDDPSTVTGSSAGPFAEVDKLAKDYGLKACGAS